MAAGALSGCGRGLTPEGARSRPSTVGDVGTAALRLHHHDRSPLCLSGRAGGRRRHRGGRPSPGVSNMRVLLTRGSMNRLAGATGGLPPDKRRAGRGYDPGRQRGAWWPGITSAGADAMVQIAARAMLAVFRWTTLADARDRRISAAKARRPPAYASCGNRGREQVLRADPWLPAASTISNNAGWLNARDLARARHILQSVRDEAASARPAPRSAIAPCSNQILASGCCPVCEMEEAGVKNRPRRSTAPALERTGPI